MNERIAPQENERIKPIELNVGRKVKLFSSLIEREKKARELDSEHYRKGLEIPIEFKGIRGRIRLDLEDDTGVVAFLHESRDILFTVGDYEGDLDPEDKEKIDPEDKKESLTHDGEESIFDVEKYLIDVIFHVPSDKDLELIRGHKLKLTIVKKNILLRSGSFSMNLSEFTNPGERKIAFVQEPSLEIPTVIPAKSLGLIGEIEAEMIKNPRPSLWTSIKSFLG